MSNAVSFVNGYVSAIQQLVNTLQSLRMMNDQLSQDPTLVARYFSTASIGIGQGQTVPRADIVAADITNAQTALVQLLFAFDSGAPTQKSILFKMLP